MDTKKHQLVLLEGLQSECKTEKILFQGAVRFAVASIPNSALELTSS